MAPSHRRPTAGHVRAGYIRLYDLVVPQQIGPQLDSSSTRPHLRRAAAALSKQPRELENVAVLNASTVGWNCSLSNANGCPAACWIACPYKHDAAAVLVRRAAWRQAALQSAAHLCWASPLDACWLQLPPRGVQGMVYVASRCKCGSCLIIGDEHSALLGVAPWCANNRLKAGQHDALWMSVAAVVRTAAQAQVLSCPVGDWVAQSSAPTRVRAGTRANDGCRWPRSRQPSGQTARQRQTYRAYFDGGPLPAEWAAAAPIHARLQQCRLHLQPSAALSHPPDDECRTVDLGPPAQ